VAKADGTVDIRKIRVGAVQQRVAIVAEGLADGETVVTEGHLRLTPGARIKPTDAPEGKPGKPAGQSTDKPGAPAKPN